MSCKLLFLGHRSLIKKITQTAVINIVFQRIFIELDVSYASPHTFSKVTFTIFENYIAGTVMSSTLAKQNEDSMTEKQNISRPSLRVTTHQPLLIM